MDRFMLTEAFNIAEEVEDFSLSASGLNELDSFLDMAGDTSMMDDEDISIIDLEAQAEDELKQSYVGKIIVKCNVCQSDIFINRDEIEINEEDEVNIDMECPYCHSMGEGYTIIGEVKPFEENAEEEADESEVEADIEDEIEMEEAEAEDVESEEEAEAEEDEENLEEALSADRVEELKKADELNGKLGLGRELESSDEVRGPHYTELNEACNEEECDESLLGNFLNHSFNTASDNNVSVSIGEDCEETLEEDIQEVSITTDDETMTMETKEDGGVVIETAPVEEIEEEEAPEEEMIAPLDDETVEDIEIAAEANAEEEIDPEVEDAEIEATEEEPEEIEDFDEESFNGLGESYLKKCYDNVNSFTTTSASINEGVLTVEGKIGFASGNEKSTKFVFEGLTSKNKQRLVGCNEQISRGKKSFKLGCNVENGKIVCESLNYNYKTKNANDESVRVYGTVRKAK